MTEIQEAQETIKEERSERIKQRARENIAVKYGSTKEYPLKERIGLVLDELFDEYERDRETREAVSLPHLQGDELMNLENRLRDVTAGLKRSVYHLQEQINRDKARRYS